MNTLKRLIFLISFLVLSISFVAGQSAPPPPPGGHGQGGNQPPGGGAPLGSGILFLLAMSIGYGATKWYRTYQSDSQNSDSVA